MFEMGHIRRVHFVGIGGVGMAGIAEVLLRQGYRVSGSDVGENTLTQWLKMMGAEVFRGHAALHIDGVDVVVRSSAIAEDNVELQAARKAHIPIVARAEMLGELMRFRYGIAIAGTHGKTTTTSLITSILAEAGLDPTFVIGGRLNSVGSNARLGRGHYLVAEADESDASFLYLKPMMSIITNIDRDHMSTYQDDFAALQAAFLSFIQGLPFYGRAILCIDDPVVKRMLPEFARPLLTYGFDEVADVRVASYQQHGLQTHFIVERSMSTPLSVVLNLPGRHNVLNAMAAIAVATELRVPDEAIVAALAAFAGIGRRFQVYADLKLSLNGHVTLVDDYGHHPREVDVTIEAVRASWPARRLVMVFQPHRYTRTHDLFSDFVAVLQKVDVLILLDVYAAGEAVIEGADSTALLSAIQSKCPQLVTGYIGEHEQLSERLSLLLKDDDVLLMQGAGNIGALAAALSESGCLSKPIGHL